MDQSRETKQKTKKGKQTKEMKNGPALDERVVDERAEDGGEDALVAEAVERPLAGALSGAGGGAGALRQLAHVRVEAALAEPRGDRDADRDFGERTELAFLRERGRKRAGRRRVAAPPSDERAQLSARRRRAAAIRAAAQSAPKPRRRAEGEPNAVARALRWIGKK